MYEYLTKNNYLFFKPQIKEIIDLVLFKENYIFAVIIKKNKIIKKKDIFIKYKDDIKNLINKELPYNVIKELWIIRDNGFYRVNLANKKVELEGF